MSMQRFLELLQNLITMSEEEENRGVGLAILNNVYMLALRSGKCDGFVLRAMGEAIECWNYIMERYDEFAGKPGHFKENEQKRHRLEMMLTPHC